jgi:hypothetical protein
MKPWAYAIAIFFLGLVAADMFFGVDISKLFSGFGKFITSILKGGSW